MIFSLLVNITGCNMLFHVEHLNFALNVFVKTVVNAQIKDEEMYLNDLNIRKVKI